jgi:NAD(P)-dependent dehydrogenase (short-subunit alcohol dehydrogenase family)
MLCRNPGRAEAVRREFLVHSNAAVEVVLAEFSDLASVRAAAEVLLRDHPRIDVLINSAGLFSTARTLSGGGFEMVFCVNHLAPFLLTHLLV